MRKFISSFAVLAFVAAALTAAPPPVNAQRLNFIRDAEIENTLRIFATPLFEAAGLDPEVIRLFIVNNSDLNAFVAGGQNMFFTTGLLMTVKTPGQLLGVIAHETGHIAGGHLARLEGEQRAAQIQSMIALALGAVAVAAGAGPAGQAIMSGGPNIIGRQLLQYTRTQEASADQAAVTYLDRTGQSSRGMLEFLQILANREHVSRIRPDPYLLSHPLTADRISFVRNHVANSRFSDVPPSPRFVELQRRMRGKLVGFLSKPAATFARYPKTDQSLEARYARAIAYYREPDLGKAIPLIDALIAEQPKDPYFRELKGQMLYENGRVAEALPAYGAAVKLLPNNALLQIELAQAQITTQDPALNKAALRHLHTAVQLERTNVAAWRQLAVAYGRAGRIDLSALALAEKALLLGDMHEARQQVARAEKLLPKGSAARLRAKDIKLEISERNQK